MSATTNRAPAVVLGDCEEDAQRWAERLKVADPTGGPYYPVVTSRYPQGIRIRRLYVTPAAKLGRGYYQTFTDLRRSMALTRGGDKHEPVFLREAE